MRPYSVLEEPGDYTTLQIKAAYRQLRYVVMSDSTVDPALPMYADVYIITNIFVSPVYTYYKTLTSYTIDSVLSILLGAGTYSFDIQDAMQEYLQSVWPHPPIATMIPAAANDTFMVVVFRGSSISGGVLIPEAPVPMQGTLTTPPYSPFIGLVSALYVVSNASILPQFHNNILSNDYEAAIAEKRLGAIFMLPDTRVYPLSNLPLGRYGSPSTYPDPNLALTTYLDDYGGFPVSIVKYGISGVLPRFTRNCRVVLIYSVEAGVIAFPPLGLNGFFDLTGSIPAQGIGTFYLPLGGKELKVALDAINPVIVPRLIDPSNNYYYFIAIEDLDGGTDCFYSPWYKLRVSTIERKRIAFLNTYGAYEWVTFVRNSEKFSAVSSEQFAPYTQLFSPSTDPLTLGHHRTKIIATDELSLTAVFPEKLMPWVKELFMSAKAFIQNENGSMMPVKVVDDTLQAKKSVIEGRINYIVTVRMAPAMDYITQRN